MLGLMDRGVEILGAGDLELVESICRQIGGHTICAFGDTMVLPYTSMIAKFRGEFAARIEGESLVMGVPPNL